MADRRKPPSTERSSRAKRSRAKLSDQRSRSARSLARRSLRTLILRGLVNAAAVVLVGLLAWPIVRPAFSVIFESSANAVLGSTTFGSGGHARFTSVSRRNAHQGSGLDDNSWDTAVRLSVAGLSETNVITINPRRLAYLPILFFLAAVTSAPLSPRRKMVCLATGAPVVVLVAAASVWITVAWLFARVPGLVYQLSPAWQTALDVGYEAFVTSIGNKYVIPLILAAALVVWQLRAERRVRGQSDQRHPS